MNSVKRTDPATATGGPHHPALTSGSSDHRLDRQQVLKVFREAKQRFEHRPHWSLFHREVLAVDGLIQRAFPDGDDLRAFRETPEFRQINAMLEELRTNPHADRETLAMITLRVPESLRDSLRAEAEQQGTSMNKLCIAKLLKMLDQ